MQKILKIWKNAGPISIILSVVFSVLFVVTAVQAATTIGSNITTDGTVTVSGLTAMGQASSTRFSVFDTAYFGGTATSTFNSAGNLSVAGTLGVTGASTLSSTLNVSGLATLGQASSTRFSVFDTAYFGGTATSTFNSVGALSIAGGAAITKHLSATASVNFAVVAGNSCDNQTMTVTGAADGDVVALGVPVALANASTTFQLTGFVSAANTITVRLCQNSASGSSDPAAATIRADVWQH